jgi:hypothetical protein
MQKGVDLDNYELVDVILGEQCDASLFELYPNELQQVLFDYAQKRRSKLILTGACLASSEKSEIFVQKGMRYTLCHENATNNGVVYSSTQNAYYHLQMQPNSKQYFVQNVQSILPVDSDGEVILRYDDTASSAAVLVGRKGRIIVAGFPFESIIGNEQRRYLMRLFLEELTK